MQKLAVDFGFFMKPNLCPWHLEIITLNEPYTASKGLRSVAGLVIQATGRMEFEDGLRPGSPGGVLSDNPSVRTTSLVTLVL